MKILRTGALLIVMSVLLVLAGGAIGGRGGLQIALAIAVVMNFVSYFFSDKIALEIERRAAGHPGTASAVVSSDGAAGGKGKYSGAERCMWCQTRRRMLSRRDGARNMRRWQ